MKKVSFFLILKLFITLLLTYNIAAVSILYFPSTNIKNLLWKWTPYNYEQSLYFPNNLSNLSLLNMNNRLLIISFLNKNSYKDYLDIDFWNYKKILESFDRNNIKKKPCPPKTSPTSKREQHLDFPGPTQGPPQSTKTNPRAPQDPSKTL